MVALRLELDNMTNLPDGGPTFLEVQGRRSVDIGRNTYLDWTLPDPTRVVSGKHCEIHYRDGGYWLTDVSTNGTYLNGSDTRLTEPARLQTGDRISIGDYLINVNVEEDDTAAASNAPAATEPPPAPSGADLWDVPSENTAPAEPRAAKRVQEATPVHPDVLDWIADIPEVAPQRDPPPAPVEMSPPADPYAAPEPADPAPAPPHRADAAEIAAPPEPPTPPEVPAQEIVAPPLATLGSAPEADAPAAPAQTAETPPDDIGAFAAAKEAENSWVPEPPEPAPPAVPTNNDQGDLDAPAATPNAFDPPEATPVNKAEEPAQVPPSQSPSPSDAPAEPAAKREWEPSSAPGGFAAAAEAASGGGAPRASLGEDFERFMVTLADALDVPRARLESGTPEETAERIGQFIALSIAGMQRLLKARATSRGYMRTGPGTQVQAVGNNPLKFMPTPAAAADVLFGPPSRSYLSIEDTLDESFADLGAHQMALYAAMQGAVGRMLKDLEPEAIEGGDTEERGFSLP
ncbi:MAG: type VI secretion system-associated FHA domain protein, partial [Pseudomonadota bacterium]